MNKSPEATGADVKNGADTVLQAAEQPEAEQEAHKELLGSSLEKSSEAEINNTLGEINHIDQEVFTAQKSITETQKKLADLKKGMGMPAGDENSPAVEFQNERVKQLEKRKNELNEEKEHWIEKNGRENLPDGIALDDGEGGREARGGSVEDDQDGELSDQEKKEDIELRKEWLKKWEERSVQKFEKAMREDWRTKDAMNLDLTVELMKRRVPEAMSKEAKEFIDGIVDEPPFSTVWIKWQTSSPFDMLLSKPNRISKLEITFDNEIQKIADESELKKEEGEEDERTKNKNTEPEGVGAVR